MIALASVYVPHHSGGRDSSLTEWLVVVGILLAIVVGGVILAYRTRVQNRNKRNDGSD
ncbi:MULTISPECIES: hypothetical protein [unclassified Gordonia (in: high G+C Gram-positive bacteria)]|uniref:hypothetical protein n=1 Tax=unclassified Gordonia (in: high G+C Gram-positive bacteria) TaxID=2657482 RepID=UPI001F10EAD9|nr:hypothetical protein [Gordonia sp. ABSL49_1]MCH5644731.1 hypothetical protein [Gordonia sp. ABSL49_1]